jgi:hypothetical protein
MSERYENDELLKRLGADDPSARGEAEAPGDRERVRAHAKDLLRSGSRQRWPGVARPRIAIAAVSALAVIGVVLALTIGGSSSGPAPALAIEKTPKLVTLRITDPTAPDSQMNQELADAGIDQVRVHSVPGAPKAVGTWAGYAEIGILGCQGSSRFGYDVDIPPAHPYNHTNHHGAENQFDLKIPHRTGRVNAEEAGTPFSKSTVHLQADSIDSHRSTVKVLVPIRPRSPDDTAASNDITLDQVIGYGGPFARYGDAIKSGQASCSDFGLKPYPKPTFPPSEGRWVVIHVTPKAGGARNMTRELRSGGIKGTVRQIPVQQAEVGRMLGWTRIPPLPKNARAHGNKGDIVPKNLALPRTKGPSANDVALRRLAFNAYPDDHWVFYVGRRTQPGETAKVLAQDGPENAKAALRRGCQGLAKVVSANGKHKYCASSLSTQVPRP